MSFLNDPTSKAAMCFIVFNAHEFEEYLVAKTILMAFDIDFEQREGFLKKWLDFYVSSTKYMISHLPLSCKILKYSQYLHPAKRNHTASLNAVGPGYLE